jgi:ATP-binding cassette subfamily B protein
VSSRGILTPTARQASAEAPVAAVERTDRAAFLRLVWQWRARVLTVLGLGTVSIVLNLMGPTVLGHATDDVLGMLRGTRTSADLARTLTLLLGVYLLSGAAWMAQNRVASTLIQLVTFQLRMRVARKLDALPVSFYDTTPRGELLSRVTNDVDNVGQTLQQSLSQATNSLLLVVGVLSVMFYISPLLACASLITVLISIAVSTLMGRTLQGVYARQWSLTGDLTALAEETYTGLSTVKALGAETARITEFSASNEQLSAATRRSQLLVGLIQPTVAAVGGLNFVLVAVLGAVQIAHGKLSVGTVQAFIQYSRQYSGPLSQVVTLSNLVQSGAVSVGRLNALLAEPETPAPVDSRPRPGSRTGALVLDRVCFGYRAERPVVHEVSLEIPEGARVALVGETGAGKTTLASLIAGFYPLTGGSIRLDGVDLDSLSRQQRARLVGIVPQDAWFFRGSIAENIGYGADRPTRADIERAGREVSADALIRSLPDGYDTLLDEDNLGLSKGELQLVSIARTQLSDPRILILDEATSAVDSRTEALVQDAMARASAGRTTLVIAHRLQTVRDADLIVVLQDGRIAEQGRHADLLARHGIYRSLYDRQLRGVEI